MWRKVLGTGGARAFRTAALLASTAITARVLGPEERGTYVAAVAWVSLFAIAGHLSLSEAAVYQGGGPARTVQAGPIAATLLALVAGLTLLGWCVALAAYAVSGGAWFRSMHPVVLALAFLQLPLLIWMEAGVAVFLLLDALPAANRAKVAGGCVNVAATFLLVAVWGGGILGALAALLLGQLTVVGAELAVVRRHLVNVRPSWTLARSLMRAGVRLHPSAAATALTLVVPVLLLGYFHPGAEVGYYQLAQQFVNGMQLLATSAGLVAYTLVADVGPDRAWPRHRVLVVQAVFLSAVAAAAAAVAAPALVHLVAGPSFLPAVPVFQAMLLAVPGMTFAAVMAPQWVGRGLFAPLGALTLAVSIIGVGAAWRGILSHGVAGAAWAFVLASGVGAVVNGAMVMWVRRASRTAVPGGGRPGSPVLANDSAA
ncbi:MAG TPA: oligosaccharide flippase family protein [Longimicrobium sp.]|nr:oligosaccharide flippase family protein [Longimicrobium sp.]